MSRRPSTERSRAQHSEYQRKRNAANPQCGRDACNRWRNKNLEYARERARRWRSENRDRVRAYNQEWRCANAEYGSEWRNRNLERCRAYLANYRGRKAFATPAWADAADIAAVYAKAVLLTKRTGIPHEVDHIIPLGGKLVCGLHVQGNLRAIPASENRAKGNRFDADQPS